MIGYVVIRRDFDALENRIADAEYMEVIGVSDDELTAMEHRDLMEKGVGKYETWSGKYPRFEVRSAPWIERTCPACRTTE